MEGAFTLELGGERIACPPLTLEQIRRICLALPQAGAGGATAEGFAAELEILLAALAPVRPGVTPEILLGLHSTRRQMMAALNAVLLAGEFLSPGESPAGSASS